MEEAASPLPHLAHPPPFPALTVMVDADDLSDPVVEAAAEQVLNTSLRAFKCRGRGGAVDLAVDDVPDAAEAAVCRITTVLTLLDPALGVGLSRPPPPPPSPSSLALLSLEEVVDPELTPLELCRTRLLWWWMFRVEPRLLLRHPDLMLPVVRRLAVSRQRLEAKIDALTLCLLPSRTETTKNWNV